MQLYVLDRSKNVLATTSSQYNDKHHKELTAGVSSFEFDINKNDEAAQYMVSGNYITTLDDQGRPWSFTILYYDEYQLYKTIYCEDVGIELYNKACDVWYYTEPHPFEYYLDLLTDGTPWELGVNQLSNLSRTLNYTGRDTGLGRLLSVLKEFDDAECIFNIQMKGPVPVKYVIDVYKKIGTVQDNIQIAYNEELNDIKKTETLQEFVTALAGVGSVIQNTETDADGTTVDNNKPQEYVNFADLEYDDGSFYTTKGDKLLRARTANAQFNPGDQGYIEDFYEYDTKSSAELFNRTLTQIQTRSQPQFTYEADVKVIDPSLDIGDTVTIIDHDYNPALYLQARVATLDKSYTDTTKGSITFTNYVVLTDTVTRQIAALKSKVNGIKNGSSSYVWIRYADDDKGTNISQSPKDKTYVAILAKVNQPVPSDNPNDYAGHWVRIAGEDGLNGQIGPQGHDGADGIPGKDGKTSYTHIAYADTATGGGFSQSSDNKKYIGIYADFEATDSTDVTKYNWSLIKGADGANGKDGVPGKAGTDGRTPYFHIAYADSADGNTNFSLDTPGSRKYIGSYTDFTKADSDNKALYSWQLVQGPKGDTGKDGVAGKDGVGIKSTQIMYAQSTSGTTAPTTGWTAQVPTLIKGQYLWTQTTWLYTDNTGEAGYTVSYNAKDGNDGTNGIAGKDGTGIKTTTITYAGSTSGTTAPTSGWTSTVPTVAAGSYLWTKTIWAYTDNTSETGYSVAMMGVKGDTGVRGLQGVKGDQGIKGPAGIDGKTSYTHIAYANSATGEGLSEQPAGKTYIGMYVDFEVTDSTNATKYKWTLVKGSDGANGTPGKTGADGRTPYLHVAYSNSADGATDFTTDNPDGKKFAYLGTYTDYTQADPTDTTKYLWSLIKGEDGANGKDGEDAYLHIAYANSVDGNTDFTTDQNQAHNRDYMGTYSDNTKAQSTDPTKYTWQLTRGAQGLQGQPGSKDVPVVTMSSTAPPSPKNGDFWYQTTTDANGQKITGFSVYSNGKWVPSKIDQSTLVLTKLVSVEIDSAIINSPDITVPFDYFDKSNNEYKGSMEFKDGMLKHISTMPDSGVLKTIISPMGYTLDAYDNQSKYTQNNPYVHSEMLADNIGFYNTNTKKSIILGSSGIRGTLNGHTDQSTEIGIYWSDIQQYLSEMSEIGGTRAFDWFDIMSSVQSHPNLLHNSSLINGINSWWINGNAYGTNVTHDGNFAVCIESTGGYNFFYQDLQHIPDPGNKICISFWANIVKNDGGINSGAVINFNGANQNYTNNLTNTRTGWQYHEFNPITVPSGTTGIRFNFYNNEHSGNKVYFTQPMVNVGDHVWPYMPTY